MGKRRGNLNAFAWGSFVGSCAGFAWGMSAGNGGWIVFCAVTGVIGMAIIMVTRP
jgi:hypothetical protein